MIKYNIDRDLLYDLYVNQKQSSLKIGGQLGICHRTLRKIMKRLDIPRRNLSEALRKKRRRNFSGCLRKRAYLLGLRAGDFWARRKNCSIRVQTSTTHLAQIELLCLALGDYGKPCQYLTKNKGRSDEWFIYVDLDSSFDFLVKKPKEVPCWILENDEYFYYFLTAYIDCEGSFKVFKSHERHVRFIFALKTGDKKILEQIEQKLESLGYYVNLYLERTKGTDSPYGRSNNDIYNLSIYQKKHIVRFIKNIIGMSIHSEKIRKMQFILDHKDSLWSCVEQPWKRLRNKIKKEIITNKAVANHHI
jgi:hypothetical protein